MTTCLICKHSTEIIGKVNSNKSCLDKSNKKIFPKSLKDIEYEECSNCGLIFSREMCNWDEDKFKKQIYNKDYIKVDTEYKKIRPINTANYLHVLLGGLPLSHLDYGSGNGLMSETLNKYGWNSSVYDPFMGHKLPTGKFELITLIEVLEHHPNPIKLVNVLSNLLSDNGIIYFSTAVSDDISDPLDWWYISPRNGHIVVYTTFSLYHLFNSVDIKLFKLEGTLYYVGYKNKPFWIDAVINGCKL